MNREEKRTVWKRARKNPDALFCPGCNRKSLFYANYNEPMQKYDVHCEACGYWLGRSKAGNNGVFGEGEIKGGQWKAGDITKKAQVMMNSILDSSWEKVEEGEFNANQDGAEDRTDGTQVDNAVHQSRETQEEAPDQLEP